jgi:hypothetical protein
MMAELDGDGLGDIVALVEDTVGGGTSLWIGLQTGGAHERRGGQAGEQLLVGETQRLPALIFRASALLGQHNMVEPVHCSGEAEAFAWIAARRRPLP